MADISSYEKFLRELAPMPMLTPEPGSLIDRLSRDLAERRAQDEAWLASLTDHARGVELTRRRIAAAESRFAVALNFRRCECDG